MSIIQSGASYSTAQNNADIDITNTGALASSASRIRLCTYLGVGGFNPYTVSNDCGIIFGNNSIAPGAFIITPHSTTSAGLRILSTGGCQSASFAATSDYRVKTNIAYLDDSYSCINLKPISYINKGTKREQYGFLAHEVQENHPFCVDGKKDELNEDGSEKLQSVYYMELIPILVSDIKRLTNEVNELKSKLIKIEDNLKV
jgi:hypothetical protein